MNSLHRYLLVDESWGQIGSFEAGSPDWSVGQTFVIDDGRSFAIVGIVPTPDLELEYTATWMVEPA